MVLPNKLPHILELMMRIELMNLFITNEVLYRLSYISKSLCNYISIKMKRQYYLL